MNVQPDPISQRPAAHGAARPTVDLNREFVLRKCDYFVDVQLWPLTPRLNPKRWLSNFSTDEMPYAMHLLNAFLYFNQPIMDQLLLAAFQGLSRLVLADSSAVAADWRRFMDVVVVTCVRGESPNATDSGFKFLRMARQVLGIPQEHILSPEDALAVLRSGTESPVVFLDDFVGSGNQFKETWERGVFVDRSGSVSFHAVCSDAQQLKFYYCPLVCTDQGRQVIAQTCPAVTLNPGYLLSKHYSALAPDSVIWPDNLRDGVQNFLINASTRAGIRDWDGFHGLALAIAFEHSVPDATLPIFYWNQNGWKPLIERT